MLKDRTYVNKNKSKMGPILKENIHKQKKAIYVSDVM